MNRTDSKLDYTIFASVPNFLTNALMGFITDAPKIQASVTKFTWEGNAANLTCEALAHPSASVQWFRDGQQLPAVNTTNIKIYSTPTVSYLEVCPPSIRCLCMPVMTP